MEVGGFELSFICRPAPSPATLPSVSPITPFGSTVIHLQHNQQILKARKENENLFFIPSFSNKFSQEIIHVIVTYSSSSSTADGGHGNEPKETNNKKTKTTELKEVITLERIKSNQTTTQLIEMKKKDLILHIELQYSWISLDLIDLNKLIPSSQVLYPPSPPPLLCSPYISLVFHCIP
jgi:hypothetical protein